MVGPAGEIPVNVSMYRLLQHFKGITGFEATEEQIRRVGPTELRYSVPKTSVKVNNRVMTYIITSPLESH
jgi:hypothetical protein